MPGTDLLPLHLYDESRGYEPGEWDDGDFFPRHPFDLRDRAREAIAFLEEHRRWCARQVGFGYDAKSFPDPYMHPEIQRLDHLLNQLTFAYYGLRFNAWKGDGVIYG